VTSVVAMPVNTVTVKPSNCIN